MQRVAVHLALTYNGTKLVQSLRAPSAREESPTEYLFGRNHAFGGKYPYQRVGVVSGTHFIIHVMDGRDIKITDMSSNGTFVNGEPLRRGHRVSLADGDRITLVGTSTRTGLIEVKYNTKCSLTAEETAMVRRYVALLGPEDAAAVADDAALERKKIDEVRLSPLHRAPGSPP